MPNDCRLASDRGSREENLPEYVVETDELNVGGEVGVNTILAEELVVLNVVSLTDE